MNKLAIFTVISLLLPLKLFTMEAPEAEFTVSESMLEQLPLEITLKIAKHLLPPKERYPLLITKQNVKLFYEKIIKTIQNYIDFVKNLAQLSIINKQLYYALRDDRFLNSLALKIARRLPASYFVEDIIDKLHSQKIDPLFIALFERVHQLFENLIYAVQHNDVNTASTLLHKLKNSHFYITSSGTFIYAVLMTSSVKMLELLLRYDSPIHYKNYFDRISSISTTVKDLYDKIALGLRLKILTTKNLSIILYILITNFVDNNQMPPLKTIKLLIDSAADLDFAVTNQTMLMLLAEKPQSDLQLTLAQLLLENGADLNKVNDNGDSAYTYAIRNNNIQLVQLFLEWTFPQAINPQILKNASELALHINNTASHQILVAMGVWAREHNFDFGE